MSVSVYPILNKEVSGFDAMEISGKALAAAIYEEGNSFAVLGRFNSANEDALKEFIADQTGQDVREIKVPAEEWFSPYEALEVVRPLLEQAAARAETSEAEALANDLRGLQEVLLLAQEHDSHFHLVTDF